MGGVFISYRRSDSYEVTRHLANFLISEFGEESTFFDQSSALPGMAWPDSIRDALEKLDALIIVIGTTWLHTHDERSGRRRIDLEDDWVRLEITTFLKRKKVNPELLVLPVLVNGATMPRSEYFDDDLKCLGDYQPTQLHVSGNGFDFTKIRQILIQHRFQPIVAPVVVTPLVGKIPRQLSDDEEREFLNEYQLWRIVEQDKPGMSGDVLRQLYRLYEFSNYETAWRFMTKIHEEGIRPHNHHPRWQNNFNRVEVWLCTANIGHKISKKDIRLAKIIEYFWNELRSDLAP